MKEKLLPYDSEPLSYEAYFRIAKNACEKAGIEERKIFEMNKTNTNKRRKIRRIFIFAAAALMMMPVAAGAYAIGTGSLDIFSKFHSGDTTSFRHDLESTLQAVSNNDITLAIDGIVADDFNCDINVSVYAQSEEGKKVIHMLENPHETKGMFNFTQLLLEHEGYDAGDNGLGAPLTFYNTAVQYPDLNSDTEYHTMLGVDMKIVDREKKFKLTDQWTGLSIEFDISPYLESYRLYADESEEDYCHYVTVSQFGVHIIGTPEDVSPMAMYYHLNRGGDIPEVYVNYADGSRVLLDGVGGNSGVSDSEETWEYMGQTFTEYEYLLVKLAEETGSEFINAKDAVSVTINGVEYKKSAEDTEKADKADETEKNEETE